MKIIIKPQSEHLHHHHIWKSQYFYVSMDIPIYLPTTKVFVQTFFLEKVWLEDTLPTYSLDICPKGAVHIRFHEAFLAAIFLFLICSSWFFNILGQMGGILICWSFRAQVHLLPSFCLLTPFLITSFLYHFT